MPFVPQMHGIVAQIAMVSQINGNMVALTASIGCPYVWQRMPRFMAMVSQVTGNGFPGNWQWLPRWFAVVALLYGYCYLDDGNGCQKDYSFSCPDELKLNLVFISPLSRNACHSWMNTQSNGVRDLQVPTIYPAM